METIAITLHINKEQHEFLQSLQQELKKKQGRKVPLSEILNNFAQIGLYFAQNPNHFVQNLKQNEQELIQSTQNLNDFTQELLNVTLKIRNKLEEYGSDTQNTKTFKQHYSEIHDQQAQLLADYDDLIRLRQEYYQELQEHEDNLRQIQYLRETNHRLTKQVEYLQEELSKAQSEIIGYQLCKSSKEYLATQVQRLQEQNSEQLEKLTNIDRLANDIEDIKYKLKQLSDLQDRMTTLMQQSNNPNEKMLDKLLTILAPVGAALYQTKKTEDLVKMLNQTNTPDKPQNLTSPDNNDQDQN